MSLDTELELIRVKRELIFILYVLAKENGGEIRIPRGEYYEKRASIEVREDGPDLIVKAVEK